MTHEQAVFLRNRKIEAGCIVKHFTRELDECRNFRSDGLFELVGFAGMGCTHVVCKELNEREVLISTFDDFFRPVDKEKYPGLRQQYTFERATLATGIKLDIRENDLVFTIRSTEFILGECSLNDILRLQMDIVKDTEYHQEVFNLNRGKGEDIWVVRCDGNTGNNFLALKVKNNIVVGLYYNFNGHTQLNPMYFDENSMPTWDYLGNRCTAEINGVTANYKVLGIPERFTIEYNIHRRYNEFMNITVELNE